MNIQQALKKMVNPPRKLQSSQYTPPKTTPKSKELIEITTKVTHISKLPDSSLIEAEKLIQYLKSIKRTYETIISVKGLSIVEYTKNLKTQVVDKITTFTKSGKKYVVKFDKKGNKISEVYDENNNLSKTATIYTQTKLPTTPTSTTIKNNKNIKKSQEIATPSTKNIKPVKRKIYYHRKTKKIETILNYDSKGNIISNETYDKSGKITSNTIFSDSLPILKTTYEEGQKKLTIEYNSFGSFKKAQEYDKNGNTVSIIEDIRNDISITEQNTTYLQTKFLKNGNSLKIEFDRSGYKIKQTEYNREGEILETINFSYTNNSPNLNPEINILEFLKHPN